MSKDFEIDIDSDDLGPQMSAHEVAKHFSEPTPALVVPEKLPENKEELKAWEDKHDNSNDIYKVAARVKNLARSNGGSLTPVGDILCNSYVHVLKAFYDFAEELNNDKIKEELLALIRKHEDLPANIIAASKSNVRR